VVDVENSLDGSMGVRGRSYVNLCGTNEASDNNQNCIYIRSAEVQRG